MPTTDPNEALPISDVREIVRLLGDVAITPGGILAQKRRLMESLAELLGSEYWMWNVSRFVDDGGITPVSMVHNISEKQLASLIDMSNDGMENPFNAAMLAQCQRETNWSRRREDILAQVNIPERFQGVPAALDMEHSIFSFQKITGSDDLYSAIGLHRAFGGKAYSLRELRIAHILLTEVRWLHDGGVPSEDGEASAALSPRLRTVLTLLIDGQSSKLIALHLGLTNNTVRGYIKDIYRHFDVNSQTELILRFSVGNGMDAR